MSVDGVTFTILDWMGSTIAQDMEDRPALFPQNVTPALALLLALGVGCGEQPHGRALLIGIDGATMKVARAMLDEGQLPNLARLTREGVAGNLRSLHPLHSPRIWNSISTGARPKKHGIVSFVWRGDDHRPHLYQSGDRKLPTLWNIASTHGLSVGVVNWWTTYPPDKINGAVVSDHFFPEQLAMLRRTFKDADEDRGALVYPESWTQRASELLESEARAVPNANPFGNMEELPSWVRRSSLRLQLEIDDAVARVALAVEEDFRPDLMMVFFAGIDRVSHWLWGNLEPPEKYPPGLRAKPLEREAGAAALYGYYRYTDALIGLLLERYGENDLVMVVSDHGFEAGVTMMVLSGLHASDEALDGVIFARGPGIPRGEPPGPVSVIDVTPTILSWLGIPPARNMDGRPAAFLRGPRPELVASYRKLKIERLATHGYGHEDTIVEQLHGLGYLEVPAGERPPGRRNEPVQGEGAEPSRD